MKRKRKNRINSRPNLEGRWTQTPQTLKKARARKKAKIQKASRKKNRKA